MRRTFVTAFLFAGGLLALAGCGDSHGGREPVSGKVTVKGGPFKVALMSIEFIPMEGQDTRAGQDVTKGTYSFDRKDGLKPGKYLIRLTAGDGKTRETHGADEEAAGPGGSTNIVSVEMIPPEFGTQSKKEVVVKAGGPNVFDIDLPYLLDPVEEAKKKKKKR